MNNDKIVLDKIENYVRQRVLEYNNTKEENRNVLNKEHFRKLLSELALMLNEREKDI